MQLTESTTNREQSNLDLNCRGAKEKGLRLSQHFTLEEMCASSTANRLGIKNVPNLAHIAAMKRLCEKVLEPLRQHFGVPIHVNSGFRNAELNRAVGGVKNSLHMQGRAADIPFKPGYLAYIRDHLPHVELVNEVKKLKNGETAHWIHVAV